MKAPKLGLAVAVAAALVLSGCAAGHRATTAATARAPAPVATTNADIKICMYTHGDGGGFWSVAKKGAQKAAADLGVDLRLPGVEQRRRGPGPAHRGRRRRGGCDGIAVSAPNPDAIQDALDKAANEAGIPLVTMNSGSSVFEELARLHPRRPGRVHRRPGGGQEVQGDRRDQDPLPDPGGEQHRPAAALRRREGHLRQRREPAALRRSRRPREEPGRDPGQARGGPDDRRGLLAERRHRHRLAAMPAAEAVGRDIIRSARSTSPVTPCQAIKDGKLAFAIDQQQYAQGYLPSSCSTSTRSTVTCSVAASRCTPVPASSPRTTPSWSRSWPRRAPADRAPWRGPGPRHGTRPARPRPPAREVRHDRDHRDSPRNAVRADTDERLATVSRFTACCDGPSSAPSWAPSSSTRCSPASTRRGSSPPSPAPPAGPTSPRPSASSPSRSRCS